MLATLYQLNVVHDSWWTGLERQGLNRKMAGTEKEFLQCLPTS